MFDSKDPAEQTGEKEKDRETQAWKFKREEQRIWEVILGLENLWKKLEKIGIALSSKGDEQRKI